MSIFVPGRPPVIVQSSHPSFDEIVLAAEAGDEATVAWIASGGDAIGATTPEEAWEAASQGRLRSEARGLVHPCSAPVSVAPGRGERREDHVPVLRALVGRTLRRAGQDRRDRLVEGTDHPRDRERQGAVPRGEPYVRQARVEARDRRGRPLRVGLQSSGARRAVPGPATILAKSRPAGRKAPLPPGWPMLMGWHLTPRETFL